jgi:hypothetical protein
MPAQIQQSHWHSLVAHHLALCEQSAVEWTGEGLQSHPPPRSCRQKQMRFFCVEQAPSRLNTHPDFGHKKGFVIWHQFDFTYFILDYCFCVYFGTAMYVDYLTFSHLNPITIPNPRPNATLTIGATARNPNYRGSRVYPNYRGSCTQH